MWISLSQAISDYGIREINAAVDPAHEGSTVNKVTPLDSTSVLTSHSAGALKTPKELPSEVSHMIEVERVVATEAFKSATRIAGLVGIVINPSIPIRTLLTQSIRALNVLTGWSADIEWIHAFGPQCDALADLYCWSSPRSIRPTGGVKLYRWTEPKWLRV